MGKKLGLAVFIIVLGFVILTSGVSASKTVVNIAVPTDPDSFDPNRSVAAATAEIAFNIYEGLVKSTPSGGLEGALASHWEIDETQTKYIFHLREAYFHNGQRVTTTDVVNALNRARDPQIGQKASEYLQILEVKATDTTVTIILSQPYSPFIYELADMAVVVYPKDAAGLGNKPIGTGPYQFAEWRPNQFVKLTRFGEHWSGKQPYFEEVFFRIIPDDNSAVLSLKTGQIDIIPRLEPSLLHQVENDSNLIVHSSPMNLVQLLTVNNQHPPLDDVRVRQALALAINRDEIIVGAAWGHGDPIYSGISPAMSEFYHPNLSEVLAYDPEQARALLVEAGYTSLNLTLDLPAPYGLHVQTGEIIAEQLRQIGVNVRIRVIEWGTWLERVYSQRDYQLSVIGLTGKLDPHPILARYQSDSQRNFFNFNNQVYDALINQAVIAPSEERSVLYQQAQEIMTKEVAGIFIMDPSQLSITTKRINGWHSYPIYVIDVATLYSER